MRVRYKQRNWNQSCVGVRHRWHITSMLVEASLDPGLNSLDFASSSHGNLGMTNTLSEKMHVLNWVAEGYE